ITALSTGQLMGGGWYTATSPQRAVRLAVIATHFNRQKSLTKALQRIRADLQQTPINDRITMLVVDNSRNLDPSQLSGIYIISNRNLVGSGGFARGLIAASDQHHTHGLFIDDDAACEAESIYRIFQLHSFARRDNTAVAGALLRDIEPFRLY